MILSTKDNDTWFGILKLYFFAFYICMLPLMSLVIFLIDQQTVNKTDMVFWVLFLVGMIPCGLIGLTLSSIGLIKSIKKRNRPNIIIGVIGIIGGISSLVGGIFGVMLIYVVVS